jgi:synaptic vesicle membrane protein VAT-1
MRQVWISKAGAPEVLQVREAADPEAAGGQVRIRVKATGINFADLMARVGLYPDAPKIPCVVGYEVSGVIDQIGEGVTGFALGDRVFGMPRFGGYTDVIALAAEQVFKLPSSMTFEEAAALPVVYITAYNMMLFTGNVRPGSSILIHSAAGGVGIAAIQLAKIYGCTILGTASKSKHEFLRAQGCTHPIDSQGDYAAAARAIVGDRGYDLLAPCGRLVAFGFSAAAAGKSRNLFHAATQLFKVKRWSPMRLMDDNKTIAGTNMGHLFGRLDLLQPQFLALLKLYEEGKIKPHIDRTFRFDEAPLAHHHIHERKAIGKVLLIP